MIDLSGPLLSLNVGRAGVLQQGDREIPTAFRKTPVDGSLRLGRLGLPGDEQVYEFHGGPDKAVCVYSRDHYPYWADRLGTAMPDVAAFGETFTVGGLTETEVHIGDVFSIGTAVVEVTQPRAPCFKIAARYGVPKMALFVQQENLTGYLLRVLEEGDVCSGQQLTLVERQPQGISVAEANQIVNQNRKDLDGARRLLGTPRLADNVREGLEQRLRIHGLGEDVERLFNE